MKQKREQQMRIWAMFCHASALLAWILLFFLVFLGIPFYLPLNIFMPLIIWQLHKAKSPWIDFQGKESLNFQISLTFYTLIVVIVSLLFILIICSVAVNYNQAVNEIKMILDGLIFVWFCITAVMLILQLFFVNWAAINAYNGKHYRYPWTIRVLR